MNSILKHFNKELAKVSAANFSSYGRSSGSGFIRKKLTGVLGGNLKLPKSRVIKSVSNRFKHGNLSLSSPDMKFNKTAGKSYAKSIKKLMKKKIVKNSLLAGLGGVGVVSIGLKNARGLAVKNSSNAGIVLDIYNNKFNKMPETKKYYKSLESKEW